MCLHAQRGFTLTELMIALALSSVVVAGMYGAFVQQQRIATHQEQLTEAWQNARLSMDIMVDEILGAGYDPGGLAGAGIVEADETHIRFTRDLNCNGTLAKSDPPGSGNKNVQDPPQGRNASDEDIAYAKRPYSCPPDCPLPPGPLFHIGRLLHEDQQPTGGYQPVADNILDLNFCYFLDTTLLDSTLKQGQDKHPGPCTEKPLQSELANIRAVQITLTAKANVPDPHYTDQNQNNKADYKQYTHYRKATLTSLVRLRNLGVNRGKDGQDKPLKLDFNEPCVLPHQ